MGIKYLKGLIDRRGLSDDLELCDSTVIIDGSSLFYYLYYDCMQDSGRCGGEYSELRGITNRFFNTLVDRCNIRCYVVFDAFRSVDKIPEYLKKKTMNIQGACTLVDGGEVTQHTRKPQPIVGKDVLKQTLTELGIPYVAVRGDADSVVAAVANALDGYVLGTDTDFCVYDLARGFLPMSDFCWENVAGTCPCKVFHRRRLESAFDLPPNAITFLEPILGKDALQNVDFSPFVSAVLTVAPARRNPRRRGNRGSPEEPKELLIWLGRKYRDDDSVIQLLKQHVSNIPEDQIRACLNVYRNLPDVKVHVDDLKQGGHSFFGGTRCLHEVGNPPVLTDFLPIVPDDQDRISCNKMSSSIRNASYQVHLVKDVGEDDTYQVLVADRQGSQYVAEMVTVTIDKPRMESLQLNLEDDVLADRNDIMGERLSYVFDVLLRGGNEAIVESFDDEMKLLAAVLRFWSTSSEDHERHVEEAIKALIFTICATYYEAPLPPEIEEIPQSSFNKGALHSSSQWLCCMKDAMFLNAILGEALESPLIGKLFSGILYQRAFAYFCWKADDLDRTAGSLFSNDAARDTFENLLRIATDMD